MLVHQLCTRSTLRAALGRAGGLALLVALAACSDSPAAPDGSINPQLGKGHSADRLQVQADNPTLLPGDTTVLRASRTVGKGRRSTPVSWHSLDGGTLTASGAQDPSLATFTANEAASYRLVATSTTFPGADTTIVNVASPSVSATITSLELRPDNATIAAGDTLRFTAWGLTAGHDSVPASVTLAPSRGRVRGMDYTCGVAGTYEVSAQLREHPSVTASSSVTVQPADAGTSDGLCPAGTTDSTTAPDSSGSPLAAVVLTPARDTVAARDTVHFKAYGVTAAGDSVAVSVTLHPDSGTVRGMDWVAVGSGPIWVRAIDGTGALADTSIITVRAAPDTSTSGAGTGDTTGTSGATDTTATAPPPLSNSTASVGELPRTSLDTRYVAPTGRVIQVAAGGDLQSAINSAARGDVIELAAGARFVGNYVLPSKAGSGWVTIRTATTLPSEGTRVTPSAAQSFAKIITPNSMPALWTATSSSASYYRVMGIELTSQASMTYAIVNLGDYARTASSVGDLPAWIILDRVYIHGTSTMDLQRCVTLNSRSSAVVDSWLSDCHYQKTDTQAIGGWSGPGPYLIQNNHLEAAGENIMFGGADPAFSGLVPSDITIRRNHIYKPLAWKGVWVAKNLIELKNAQRVLVEENVLENNWADGQTGFAIVMKSVNQGGACDWCVVQNITLRHNLLVNSPGGVNLSARETEHGGTAVTANSISITDNLFQNVAQSSMAGSRILFQLTGGMDRVAISHNSGFTSDKDVLFDGTPTSGVQVSGNLWMRGQYGVFGSGHGEGSSAIAYYMPDGTVRDNLIIAAPSSEYPAGNFYPSSTAAAGVLDVGDGNYVVTSSSPYYLRGSDGRSPGTDAASLLAALQGVR